MAGEASEMKKTMGAPTPGEDAVDWEAAFRQIFDQMEQADDRIRTYQSDIDQLKAETRAMLARMQEQLQEPGGE
jgi:uncharacterized protein YecA (UPF0149 family)